MPLVFGPGRAQGELDVVKHRLEALAREKDMATMGASSKIEELEAKVLQGEVQRRRMHNLIQVRPRSRSRSTMRGDVEEGFLLKACVAFLSPRSRWPGLDVPEAIVLRALGTRLKSSFLHFMSVPASG